MKRKTLNILAGPLLASAAPAMAHHSFLFDSSKTITLTGALETGRRQGRGQ